MAHRFAVTAACISLFALLAGCSSKELTRSRAKDIIQNSDLFKPQQRQIRLAPDEAKLLAQKRYIQVIRFVNLIDLTPEGKNFFAKVGGDGVMEAYWVTPIRPMPLKITEVTGITDGAEGAKRVEYHWVWEISGLPDEVKTTVFARNPINTGAATFKLYDDGWRVSEWK